SEVRMKTPKGAEAGNAPPHQEEPAVHPLDSVEERLQLILGLTNSILFEFDAEGRYLSVSTPSEELLATPREQLLGRTIPEVIGPEAAAPFMERIRNLLTEGHSGVFEYDL